MNTLHVQQLSAARTVCGFGSACWSRKKLLEKVNWLSVRQVVFYHIVLQVHKTLSTSVPKPLYQNLSLTYPRVTRGATGWQLRQDGNSISAETFKYKAIESYNLVPVEVKTGSIISMKAKLKKWIRENIPIV